jgi:hypothetical protein
MPKFDRRIEDFLLEWDLDLGWDGWVLWKPLPCTLPNVAPIVAKTLYVANVIVTI